MKYFFIEKKFNRSFFKKDTLAGFSSRNKNNPTFGKNELGFRIFWLNTNDIDFIIISIDTLYLNSSLADAITFFLKEKYYIDHENIIFNATHTHSSPNIEKNFNIHLVDNHAKKLFISEIKEALTDLNKSDFTPCQLKFNTTHVSNNMFISRRKIGRDIRQFFITQKIIFSPNSDKKIDDKIRLLTIWDNDELKLVIYNLSCHPVFNSNLEVSSDFPGEIADRIQRKTGANVLFLQGFLGDIRPNQTTTSSKGLGLVSRLKLLFNKPIFKPYTLQFYNRFCDSLVKDIIDGCRNGVSIVIPFKYRTTYKTYRISSNNKMDQKFEIKFVKLDTLFFISIPAEVTSIYYLKLQAKFPNINIIPLSLAPGIIGYLPHPTEVLEGGYEVSSSKNYGWDGNFDYNSIEIFYNSLIKDIKSFIGE